MGCSSEIPLLSLAPTLQPLASDAQGQTGAH